eukprot:TRINITY_DN26459_c0_g2_i1.p1 TRINITY_DN26459_c0_g2~~TRINITY_DN26459_c0_g2_i1.p1  ORF type:complete len:388 (-),score=44.33 TRINITY_DN26459_c0_g2_i1:376-1539(-)
MDRCDLEGKSVRELKQLLAQRGLDASGCLEKSDIVNRLRDVLPAQSTFGKATEPVASQHGGQQSHDEKFRALERLPLSELRGLLKCHGAEDMLRGAREKQELLTALAACLSRCPICLENADDGDLSNSMQRCDACRAPFHQRCCAGHALAAAEAASLPLLCPVPGCKSRWRGSIVAWALTEEELCRYNAAVRSIRELRGGTSRSDTPTLSPRTSDAMKQLGVRACPKCHAMIEKQDPGLTHGCDKMTCRCGCRFCFQCGTLAGDNGEARCKCVGDHHSYLTHEQVLRDYDDLPDGPNLGRFFQQAVGEAFRATADGTGRNAASMPFQDIGSFVGQAMSGGLHANAGHGLGRGGQAFQPGTAFTNILGQAFGAMHGTGAAGTSHAYFR